MLLLIWKYTIKAIYIDELIDYLAKGIYLLIYSSIKTILSLIKSYKTKFYINSLISET